MQTKVQASHSRKGDGRALRRARNVVKKWERDALKRTSSRFTQEDWEIQNAINDARYVRACALIAYNKIAKS